MSWKNTTLKEKEKEKSFPSRPIILLTDLNIIFTMMSPIPPVSWYVYCSEVPLRPSNSTGREIKVHEWAMNEMHSREIIIAIARIA